jgi:integrase
MAHIRKRHLPSGKLRWQVTWQAGSKRASEMFDTQREAKEKFLAVEGSKPSSTSVFRILAQEYLDYEQTLVDTGEHERSYFEMLRGHVNNHILVDSEFSNLRCCSIGTPEVQLYFNRLITRVPAKSAVKIRTTLSQIFKFGTQTGFVSANPVRDAAIKRKRRPDAGKEAPFVLPEKNALRDLLSGAETFDTTGRASAVVRVLMFAGLRMSELRGLERPACRLVGDAPVLSITQRADRYNVIGSVKSNAGRRTVDLGPETAQALRIWLIAAPKARQEPNAGGAAPPPELAFPNDNGGVWGYPNFRSRFWVPLMNHCGLVTDEPADEHIRTYAKANNEFHKPAFSPHMLRHVYASLQIEQGVTPKRLQKLIGHSTLKMTLDTYGHLWPDEDADRARARGVERMI